MKGSNELRKWLVALILVCACVSASAKDAVIIAFYGDSTVYGTQMQPGGTYIRSRNNEPDTVQWDLQKVFGVRVFVQNHGVPGSICSDFLWGQNSVSQDWRKEMANSTADVIVYNTGINDAGRMDNTGFIWCEQQIVGIAQQAGKKVIIETPNPVAFVWNSNIWGVVHNEQYVASTTGATLADFWSAIMNSSFNWKPMLADGIHPNDQMYQLKAINIEATLTPMVQTILEK